MVISGFLTLFRNAHLERLKIVTLEPPVSNTRSSSIKHDWPSAHDMQQLIEAWLEATAADKPHVMMCRKTHDLRHSRVLSISWSSGKTTRLILDQGASYWQPRAQYADQLAFNFNAQAKTQGLRMFEQYKLVNMVSGGAWSTMFYILTEYQGRGLLRASFRSTYDISMLCAYL
jgi:DEAD/DEAH box helicase domain-containing protein